MCPLPPAGLRAQGPGAKKQKHMLFKAVAQSVGRSEGLDKAKNDKMCFVSDCSVRPTYFLKKEMIQESWKENKTCW